jgi:hypothetical protein
MIRIERESTRNLSKESKRTIESVETRNILSEQTAKTVHTESRHGRELRYSSI